RALVAIGHIPELLAAHLFRRTCVPVISKAVAAAALVCRVVLLLMTWSRVIRRQFLLTLKAFWVSWPTTSEIQPSMTALIVMALNTSVPTGACIFRCSIP